MRVSPVQLLLKHTVSVQIRPNVALGEGTSLTARRSRLISTIGRCRDSLLTHLLVQADVRALRVVNLRANIFRLFRERGHCLFG